MTPTEEQSPIEFDVVIESIELRVDGQWTAADLEGLLGAVSRIYNASLLHFLTRDDTEIELTDIAPSAELGRQQTAVELEPLHFDEPEQPTGEGSTPDVADSVRERLFPPASKVTMGTRGPPFASQGDVATFRLQALEGQRLPLGREVRLRIESISIASPGLISLKGLGEPLKQLRLLIERLAELPAKLKDAKIDRAAKEEENQTRAALNEVMVFQARMKAIEDLLELQWGPDFRSLPHVQKQIQDLFSDVRCLSDLAQSGKLLPPAGG